MIEVTEEKLKIDVKNYLRTRKIFDFIIKLSKVNIRLHETGDTIKKGDIFLFNHFSRFETFIPQYLFFKKAKVFSRPIAAASFFEEGGYLANYLLSIGAIPSNFPNILNFLTKEINRGIKLIVFPEGSMIKDKKVVDRFGLYSIYSRDKRLKRRPHTGASVIALRVESCRFLYRLAMQKRNKDKISYYCKSCPTDDNAAGEPVYMEPARIVPATITFFPLRISENFLKFLAEHIGKKKQRHIEEMAIEGNFITKETDMDIYLSSPINVGDFFSFIDKTILNAFYYLKIAPEPDSNKKHYFPEKIFRHLYEGRIRLLAKRLTRKCMGEIYSNVTVNLYHLASQLIFGMLIENSFQIEKKKFFNVLYFAIKELQKEKDIILHPHLKNPNEYGSLKNMENYRLKRFLQMAEEENLITIDENSLSFSPKLMETYEFDTIRLTNTPRVIFNETQPIKPVRNIVKKAFINYKKRQKNKLSDYYFDDDSILYRQDNEKYAIADYDKINQRETKTLSGKPFFLKSNRRKGRKKGILLIHGFPASPAEMKPLGNFLHKKGYTVYGARLKGHGTSPHDMDQTTWDECIKSIEYGYDALNMHCEKIVPIGFSFGAAIALDLAGQLREKVCSAVSISAPVEVEGMDNISLTFSAKIEKFFKLIPGVKSKFIEWKTESPEINYRSIPLQKLVDLKNYIEQMKTKLQSVSIPLLIIQGKDDPFVKPKSAKFIYEAVSSKEKRIYWHESDKHNIVQKDCIGVYNNIQDFINRH